MCLCLECLQHSRSSSLLTCSGWDRDRLGWKKAGAPYRIDAHDRDGGFVNGDDLSARFRLRQGCYTVRDRLPMR